MTPIVIVGALPPPVNGYAIITKRLHEILGEKRPTICLDISPGTTRRGFVYHGRRVLRVLRTLAQLCIIRTRHRGFETYIATESRAGLVYTILIAVLANAMGSHAYLHHHVFRYIDERSRLMSLLVRLTRKRSTHIFLCNCMSERFRRTYGETIAWTVLSNLGFIDPAQTSLADTEVNGGHLTVALLSNLTREKGLYEFLALADAAKRKGLPLRFLLAGPTSNAIDTQAVRDASRDALVTYMGPLYGPAKEAFFGSADVFVFPTSYANEAQPMVLYEALAHGCKIIAYDRGCIAEQVANRGWVIPKAADFVETALVHLNQIVKNAGELRASRQNIRQSIAVEHALARTLLENMLAHEQT